MLLIKMLLGRDILLCLVKSHEPVFSPVSSSFAVGTENGRLGEGGGIC